MTPKRKGHSYATILIDMDTHRPIDVLEDRQAGTLAQWLKEHPGVQVICRGRAGAYAEGAREGAPDAIQVADRFHLWQNLCDAVEKTVISCRADLREPVPKPGGHKPAGCGGSVPAETTGPAAQDSGDGRLAIRARERHAAIHDLLAQGRNYTQISEILGLTRHTVRKFARAATAGQVIPAPARVPAASTASPPICSSAGTRGAPTPPSCSPRSRRRATPAASGQRAATCSRCAPRSPLPCSRCPRPPSGK